MKAQDQYLKFVLWSEEDSVYIGYYLDLFPWGGVCHDADEQRAYQKLSELVSEEIGALEEAGQALPEPTTRPMREAAGV